MKKNIAIVSGGNSSEWVISVKSARLILDNVDREFFNPYVVTIHEKNWSVEVDQQSNIPVDKNDFSYQLKGNKINFDAALVMIHGTPGEDGKLQGYFDMLGIPYSSCDVLSSAITFNKVFCKNYLEKFGIASARYHLIKKNDNVGPAQVIAKTGLPCFIKPNNGGSSFGVTKIKSMDEFGKAVKDALKEDNEVLVEEFLEGTEITCGLLKTSKKEYIFPITEIVSKNEFFDYEAKYTDGMSEEITPARIPKELEDECKKISSRIYDILNCKGLVRIDYIHSKGKLYLLEVNTIPGMSPNSIVPQQIRAAGMSVKDILTEILDDCV
jgi:D-alanine-D-alanine ligase